MNSTSITARHKSGSTFLWLAYTLFIFMQPLFDPSRALWAISLIALAMFLCIFLVYVRTEDETLRRWMIVATFVTGLLSFPFNGGASTFFVYTAAFIPFTFASTPLVLSLFSAVAVGIGLEWVTFRTPRVMHGLNMHVSWENAVFALFLMLVIGGSNIFFAKQRRADCKLQAALEENVTLAAVAERERIARDLHDVLGHTLSVIVLKAELAKRLMTTNPERAALEIADVEATARTALAEVREAIGGYRARGLAAEIEAARRTLDAAGVTLVHDSEAGPAAALTPAEETVLALALREAVTNIVRHAKARTCRLRFVSEGGRRRLQVEDDGEHPVAREGNGLRGMRERVEALGGSLSLTCDHGTTLLIELPLRAEPA